MSTNAALTVGTRAPHLILIARAHAPPGSLADAWRRAIARYFPAELVSSEREAAVEQARFTVREGSLGEMDPAEVRCDCIVSPANSFGIMDGGFDLELSKMFQGKSADIYRLTDHVQSHLRTRWGGFAPAGSCTLVPLPCSVRGPERNAWGTHAVAMVPTMKQPEEVKWNKELVYNAMWSLLNEVALWNAEAEDGKRQPRIERVLMTGLGTGAGGVSVERCARQMVLAVKHFEDGLPEKVRWETIRERMDELEDTAAYDG